MSYFGFIDGLIHLGLISLIFLVRITCVKIWNCVVLTSSIVFKLVLNCTLVITSMIWRIIGPFQWLHLHHPQFNFNFNSISVTAFASSSPASSSPLPCSAPPTGAINSPSPHLTSPTLFVRKISITSTVTLLPWDFFSCAITYQITIKSPYWYQYQYSFLCSPSWSR